MEDWLIYDALLRLGFLEIAELFKNESGFRSPKQAQKSNSIDRVVDQIRKNLMHGQISASVKLIRENYPQLLADTRSEPAFALTIQQVIEKIVACDGLDNIFETAAPLTASMGDEQKRTLIEEMLCLLAFASEPPSRATSDGSEVGRNANSCNLLFSAAIRIRNGKDRHIYA